MIITYGFLARLDEHMSYAQIHAEQDTIYTGWLLLKVLGVWLPVSMKSLTAEARLVI